MKSTKTGYTKFLKYRDRIQSMQDIENWKEQLSIDAGNNLQISYAPFDYVNESAKLVIVGITPGEQQALNAIMSVKEGIARGYDDTTILRKAKSFSSFSGRMRSNLVRMLDHVGVPELLEIESSSSLFDEDCSIGHFTSVLRYPVFHNGSNYNGVPSIQKCGMLANQVENYFGEEVMLLPDALYVPLGPIVTKVLYSFVKDGKLDENQILDGIPHPSGANAERISYFLGDKDSENCSAKTDTAKMDLAKLKLIEKLGLDLFLSHISPSH